MLSLPEIQRFYPEPIRRFSRFILREYLQHKILEIIFNSEAANRLCLLGGTCLRVVHGNSRFSEDLDFDNFNLSTEAFEKVSDTIRKSMEAEGYQVEIHNRVAGAFHCHILFPGLLFQQGLSGHLQEKILVRLDTEPQHFNFQPETHILNRFDIFTTIFTTPPDILLSQKFYAILNRDRNKGRDFFDAAFLLQNTRPNYDYLNQKLEISNGPQLTEALIAHCQTLSMEDMARDVAPFLFEARQARKVLLFPDYIRQVKL